ncbi:hypothetical protein K1T71_002218 [Dendrolimus kikuchii]|uniref:Uncharacterized protein n=1 Tax=Dendrolimus kikuchii TaxID=765133 RepID=A0ACC1DFW0_9NEOP|nr:hypothetical protein K1T71_002218 [Dendrolimus kikuchii]
MPASTTSFADMDELARLNTVHVRQKVTVFVGNKYVVCSPSGDVLFYAKEEGGALSLFQGKKRPFHIDIFDTQKRQASLRRPYTFGPAKMDVKVNGSLVSVVRVEPTFMTPVLNINDANDKRLLRVKGPISTQGIADFEIFTNNKTRVGCIQKQWSGFMQEAFTNADSFLLTFPVDLDVRVKAAIIGTCFLISHVTKTLVYRYHIELILILIDAQVL